MSSVSGRDDEPECHARIQQVLDYANGVNKSSQITQIEPEQSQDSQNNQNGQNQNQNLRWKYNDSMSASSYGFAS